MLDDDFTPWTPDGAERLRVAAAELAAAVIAHADAVTAVQGDAGILQVFQAGERLLPAVLAYADAQFDYTGNGAPFGALHDLADEDDGDDVAEELEPEPTTGVCVLQRRDYRVSDEAAVLSAGRRAHLSAWPENDESDAVQTVTHLGRALYEVGHAHGWDSLDKVEGLRQTGGYVVVVDRDDTLGADRDQWPEDLFDVDGEVLYEQEDVFVD